MLDSVYRLTTLKNNHDVISCRVDPPLPRWDPSDHQACCTSPAWKESSSSDTFWWMAWHPLFPGRSHRSPPHPQEQSRTLSSVSADLPLTCGQQQSSAMQETTAARSRSGPGWTVFLPVTNQVRFFNDRYILHSLTVHFFTDFINRRLQPETNCCYGNSNRCAQRHINKHVSPHLWESRVLWNRVWMLALKVEAGRKDRLLRLLATISVGIEKSDQFHWDQAVSCWLCICYT